jgi:hypothetical protein
LHSEVQLLQAFINELVLQQLQVVLEEVQSQFWAVHMKFHLVQMKHQQPLNPFSFMLIIRERRV